MIEATPEAVRHLREILAAQGAPSTHGLRLAVERGGCAGFQYTMKIDAPADGDTVVEQDGIRLLIAADSASFLQNIRLDYEDSLNDSGFRIDNSQAARSCGCGTSFEPVPSP